jgi:hypothetical protein
MVVLELCADVLMVVHKVIHGHLAIVGETFVGTVKICEKIEKFESCLLNGLKTRLHVGVASRVKLTLHFVKVQGAVFVLVKPFESFLNQTTAVVVKFSNKFVHELI